MYSVSPSNHAPQRVPRSIAMDGMALCFALKDSSISQPPARPQLVGGGCCPTSKLVPAVKRPLEPSFDPIKQGSPKSRTTLSRSIESGLASPLPPQKPTRADVENKQPYRPALGRASQREQEVVCQCCRKP